MSKDIVAGGITGILSQLLTWPTEFLKTTKQLPKYKNQSIFNSVKKEVYLNGPKVFYRGSLAQVISAFPRSATRFTVYNKTHSFLDKNNINPTVAKMFSGIIAGSTEAFFIQTPAEIIKVQCINKKINAVNATKTIFLENGTSKKKAYFYLLIFAAMAPLGLFTSQVFEGIIVYNNEIMAIVIGILLHISTTIIFESSNNHKFTKSKIIAICLGIIVGLFS